MSDGYPGRASSKTGSNLLLTHDHPDDRQSAVSTLGRWMHYFPKRYILAIMAFLGCCNVYTLRVNLSVAIVAMTNNRTIVVDNHTVVMPADFDWDLQTQGLLLSSFYYGYIITQIPGGYLAKEFGGCRLFGIGIFAAAIITLLTPLCASWHLYLLLAARFTIGLFEGLIYPSLHAVWARWAPPPEKTWLSSIVFSGPVFGVAIAFSTCGALANSNAGWPSIFYVFGVLGVIWFISWWFLVTEAPELHSTISSEELKYLQHTIGFDNDQQIKRMEIPWKSMLTSVPVWAIVAAHFAENWGFDTWITLLPTFMNDILHFDLKSTGFLAPVPYLAMALLIPTSGYLADYMRRNAICDTTTVRKAFTCSAFAFQGVLIIIAGYIMSPGATVACITIAVGFGGFAQAGYLVNHLDLAPQFASILMGLSNTVATIPGIASPSLAGAIVRNQEASEWQIVFYLASGIYAFGSVIYGVFGSGRQQPWATEYTSYS